MIKCINRRITKTNEWGAQSRLVYLLQGKFKKERNINKGARFVHEEQLWGSL